MGYTAKGLRFFGWLSPRNTKAAYVAQRNADMVASKRIANHNLVCVLAMIRITLQSSNAITTGVRQ